MIALDVHEALDYLTENFGVPGGQARWERFDGLLFAMEADSWFRRRGFTPAEAIAAFTAREPALNDADGGRRAD